MRVVLDANVLVSAAISPLGAPWRVVRLARDGRIDLVTSEALIEEVRLALRYPRVRRRTRWSAEETDAFIDRLHSAATFVTPTRRITASRDPDDNAVLEAAAAGNADYIVTGDQDLLTLGAHRGIVILTPAAFASLLQA